MSSHRKRIESEALNLSPQERADLADKLWLSVESPAEAAQAWNREIGQRIAELDSGAVVPLSHEDVVADLRSRHGK